MRPNSGATNATKVAKLMVNYDHIAFHQQSLKPIENYQVLMDI